MPLRTGWTLVVFIMLLATGCGAAPNAQTPEETTLTIFAASSLTDVVQEIGEQYLAANPGTTLVYQFGASSTLAIQITEGAQADVFLSANPDQVQNVVDVELNSGEPVTFTTNKLVVAVPNGNPAQIETLDDLTNNGVRIATAIPGVPIREYTDAMIASLPGYPVDAFYANVISEETNVRQVISKLVLDEIDAAVVYKSDITPTVAEDVIALDIIPENANVLAEYLGVALKGDHEETAQQFMAYIVSDDAVSIFSKWGFGG